MDKVIKDLIKDILKIENFDLKTYYNYIEVYGKEIISEAFDKILLKIVTEICQFLLFDNYVINRHFIA